MNFPTSWNPKYLREALCAQQVYAPDEETRRAISRLLLALEAHRPLDSAGVHGDLHTSTCGCEDAPVGDPQGPTVEHEEGGIRMTDAEFESFMRAAKGL